MTLHLITANCKHLTGFINFFTNLDCRWELRGYEVYGFIWIFALFCLFDNCKNDQQLRRKTRIWGITTWLVLLNRLWWESLLLCFWERLRNTSIYAITPLTPTGRWCRSTKFNWRWIQVMFGNGKHPVSPPLEELVKVKTFGASATGPNQHSRDGFEWKTPPSRNCFQDCRIASVKICQRKAPRFGKIWQVVQSSQGFSLLHPTGFYTSQWLITFNWNKLLEALFEIPGRGESLTSCRHTGVFCILTSVLFICFYTTRWVLLHNWLQKYLSVQELFLMMTTETPLKYLMKRQKCSGLFMRVVHFLFEKKTPAINGFLNAVGTRKTKTNGWKLKPRQIQMRRF